MHALLYREMQPKSCHVLHTHMPFRTEMAQSDGEDSDLELSSATLAALNEFRQEEATRQQVQDDLLSGKLAHQPGSQVDEDWQLSQFWYDDDTAYRLAREASRCIAENGKRRVALISAPTTYMALQKHFPQALEAGNVKIFEFDTRFSALAAKNFVYYDFNSPLKFVSSDERDGATGLREEFDLVMADPPYLDENCLTKTSISIKYLGKEGAKIVLCTGAVMEDLAKRLLGLYICTEWEPKHKNNLANEFKCFTNYNQEYEKEITK